MYCRDTYKLLADVWDYVVDTTTSTTDAVGTYSHHHHHHNHDNDEDIPLLLQYGDMKTSHRYGILQIPHIKKFRSATTSKASQSMVPNFYGLLLSTTASSSSSPSLLRSATSTSSNNEEQQECRTGPPIPLDTVHGSTIMQPIIWKLATHRHYRLLDLVASYDTPWYKKKNKAIFRGQLTGALQFYNKTLSPYQNCVQSIRCRLVYHHAKSKYVNAKLTSTRNRLPDVINDSVTITGQSLSVRHLLEYKAIIMIEGNDVASGLKWALLSQSVVLMPPPKHTSWAMEELLQPWVVR